MRRNPLSSVRPSDSFFVRLLASLLLIRLGFLCCVWQRDEHSDNAQGKPAGRHWNNCALPWFLDCFGWRSSTMNGIVYLVGLIVVVLFILSFLGLR